MKLNIPSIGVLATIIALASITGIYALSFDSDFEIFGDNDNRPSSGAMFLGNVKVTHFDENGKVIGYRQGDNHITKWGMGVIMSQIFADVNATYKPLGNISGRVSHMQIGTGGEQTSYANELAWNNTDIAQPIGGTCKRVRVDSIENTTQGTAHPAPSSCFNLDANPGVGKEDCNARHNVTATAQFQGADCGVASIDEAGIYTGNNAQGDLMFARNTFGSVTLGPLDTLQLEWEFTFTDS